MCTMNVKRVVVDCIPASCVDCAFVTTNVNHHFVPGDGYLNDDFFCGIVDRPETAARVTEFVLATPTEPNYAHRPIFCPLTFED